MCQHGRKMAFYSSTCGSRRLHLWWAISWSFSLWCQNTENAGIVRIPFPLKVWVAVIRENHDLCYSEPRLSTELVCDVALPIRHRKQFANCPLCCFCLTFCLYCKTPRCPDSWFPSSCRLFILSSSALWGSWGSRPPEGTPESSLVAPSGTSTNTACRRGSRKHFNQIVQSDKPWGTVTGNRPQRVRWEWHLCSF